ncbi:MAG TPA: TetR/AcrR family transcriptional regulator [Hyphomicrobiaceae bacterium]|nr:TetR/AcrR family transcriptional regulator [Hyphomicrobiaceae bacterium]
MIDQTTQKGRVLNAALACAAQKDWAKITLLDIAEAANLRVVDLRDEFNSKESILAALLRAVDDEVLKQAPHRTKDQDPRDALFDVIMTRFDVLAPHKAALKSIYASGAADFALAGPYLASQHWMLQAAGIGTDGPLGGLRVSGLAVIYASIFRTWLEDDDPGLARTMAALDRRLRRGQSALRTIEQVGDAAYRLATDTRGFLQTILRAAAGRGDDSAGASPGKAGGADKDAP